MSVVHERCRRLERGVSCPGRSEDLGEDKTTTERRKNVQWPPAPPKKQKSSQANSEAIALENEQERVVRERCRIFERGVSCPGRSEDLGTEKTTTEAKKFGKKQPALPQKNKSSQANSGAIALESEEEIARRNASIKDQVLGMYQDFVREVDPKDVLDLLIQRRIISIERKQELMSEKTKQDRCRKFLDWILTCSHSEAFIVLREALNKQHSWIVKRIDDGCRQMESTGKSNCDPKKQEQESSNIHACQQGGSRTSSLVSKVFVNSASSSNVVSGCSSPPLVTTVKWEPPTSNIKSGFSRIYHHPPPLTRAKSTPELNLINTGSHRPDCLSNHRPLPFGQLRSTVEVKSTVASCSAGWSPRHCLATQRPLISPGFLNPPTPILIPHPLHPPPPPRCLIFRPSTRATRALDPIAPALLLVQPVEFCC